MTLAFLKKVLPSPPPQPGAPPGRGGKGPSGLAPSADGTKVSFRVVPQHDPVLCTTASQECKIQKSTPAWDTRAKLRPCHSGQGCQRAGSQVSRKENVPVTEPGVRAGSRPRAVFQCRPWHAGKGRWVLARTPGSRAHDGQGCARLCRDNGGKTGPAHGQEGCGKHDWECERSGPGVVTTKRSGQQELSRHKDVGAQRTPENRRTAAQMMWPL